MAGRRHQKKNSKGKRRSSQPASHPTPRPSTSADLHVEKPVCTEEDPTTSTSTTITPTTPTTTCTFERRRDSNNRWFTTPETLLTAMERDLTTLKNRESRCCIPFGKEDRYGNIILSYLICVAPHEPGHVCSSPFNPNGFTDADKDMYELLLQDKPRRHFFRMDWYDPSKNHDKKMIPKLTGLFTEFIKSETGVETCFSVTGSTSRHNSYLYLHQAQIVCRNLIFTTAKEQEAMMERFFSLYVTTGKNARC